MSRLYDPVEPAEHFLGASDARITLVEFGDYACPHCARAHRTVTDLLRDFGHTTRFVFRHFPLAHRHIHAPLAAQAAEAAGAQGQFWQMHASLFARQDALDPASLRARAAWLGLDLGRFDDEMFTAAHRPKVEADFRGGLRSGVHGTPRFFLNERSIDSGWDPASLAAAIERAAHPQH